MDDFFTSGPWKIASNSASVGSEWPWSEQCSDGRSCEHRPIRVMEVEAGRIQPASAEQRDRLELAPRGGSPQQRPSAAAWYDAERG
jgi:hypothetical protein